MSLPDAVLKKLYYQNALAGGEGTADDRLAAVGAGRYQVRGTRYQACRAVKLPSLSFNVTLQWNSRVTHTAVGHWRQRRQLDRPGT